MLVADRPEAFSPRIAARASAKSPVEIPFRYSAGSNASMLGVRRINRGRIALVNRPPSAYGLRSGELVRLTLDDIDWRGRTLRVAQTKTKQAIRLPLSDEAANLLIDYLRKARPESPHRHLFLRMRAPEGPLKSSSVHDVLDHRRRLSGLDLPVFGTHV